MNKRKFKFEYMENLAEELKGYLAILRKKKSAKIPEETELIPEDFTCEFLDISVDALKHIERIHLYRVDQAIKYFHRFGKVHLAQMIKEFVEALIESPIVFPGEKTEILNKFSVLMKEMSVPEIYQKTKIVNTLYPEVRQLVLCIEELSGQWRNLEAALEDNTKKSGAF